MLKVEIERAPLLTLRRVLRAICLMFVTLSLFVAIATPWGEANDEPDHVHNVETIVDGHWYRIRRDAWLQPHQPPLYYLGLAGWQQLLGVPEEDEMVRDLHRYSPKAPVVFRHDQANDGSAQRLFTLLRLPNIVLGLATILLTAAIARRVSCDRWTPVIAAALVAPIPKFVFLSGVINNDNLATALAAAATLLALALVTTRLTPRGHLVGAGALGILAGLLAITKFSTLPLTAAFVLALVLARTRQWLWSLVVFGGAFIATSGWWFAMNTYWYGDPWPEPRARPTCNAYYHG